MTDVVVGCVAENTPPFLDGAVRLLRSLRWFGGRVADARFVACVVGECPPAYAETLGALGATVARVERCVEGNAFSNKLRFYEHPDVCRPGQVTLLLDCDTAVVQDPAPWLQSGAVRAKPADLPTVPTPTLASLCRHFGLPVPPPSCRTTFEDHESIWYCNSGVIVLPSDAIPALIPNWGRFVRALLDRPDLLAPHTLHCNQAALALAYVASGLAFDELPVEMNFPLHITDRPSRLHLDAVDPVILHYHRKVEASGVLRASRFRGAQARIEALNRRLAATASHCCAPRPQ